MQALARSASDSRANSILIGTKGPKSVMHRAATQAHFVTWYNPCRKHDALKNQTPVMASRLSDHVWTIKELVEKAAHA